MDRGGRAERSSGGPDYADSSATSFLSMTIVADENIPFVNRLFTSFGRVAVRPATDIDAECVRDADVLLVRSVTRVDERLLAGSTVRFVGSATIGTDHVDQNYLAGRGIPFAHAPGSNADSVAEYVLAAMLAVLSDRGEAIAGRTVGVVGAGHIGGQLIERLQALEAKVLVSDPPLARGGVLESDAPLCSILDEADFLTLHCPLTRSGPDATEHLIDRNALARMRHDATIINTARGAIVDNRALADALGSGSIRGAILDVWENEPLPAPELIDLADIATPHIAGYSYDGKVTGTIMLAEALCAWTGDSPDPSWYDLLAATHLDPLHVPEASLPETAWLDAVVRQMVDVRADSRAFKQFVGTAEPLRMARFRELRRTYAPRRSFSRYRIGGSVPGRLRTLLEGGLRVRLVNKD